MKGSRGLQFAILIALLIGGGVGLFFALRDPSIERRLARAENFYEKGAFDAARIECRNILRADPAHFEANSLLSRIWFDQGAPLQSLHFAQQAHEADASHLETRSLLAMAYRSLGQPAAAHREALAVLAGDPAHLRALIVLAESAHSAEHIREIEEALAKVPDQDSAVFLLPSAMLLLKKGDLAGAKTALDAAANSDPQIPEVHVGLGHWHLLAGNVPEAAKSFERAHRIAPPYSPAKRKYAEFLWRHGRFAEAHAHLAALTTQQPFDLTAWRLRARIAVQERNYEEALEMLRPVLLQIRTDYQAMLLQARILQLKGEPKKAQDKWQEVDTLYGKVPAIRLELARAYLENRQLPKALDLLKKTLVLSPGYTDARLLLAELRLDQGQKEEVAAELRAMLKAQPALSEARILLAKALRSLGRIDEAIASLQEQVERTPGEADLHFVLGLMLRQQNRNEEARQAFVTASELNPSNLVPRFQLVEMKVADGAPDLAKQEILAILEEHPDSAEAQYYHAKVLYGLGEWEAAHAANAEALRHRPGFASALGLAVRISLKRGNPPQIQAAIKAALDQGNFDPQIMLLAAGYYEGIQDFTKARGLYELTEARHPKFVPVLNNLAWLLATRFDELEEASKLIGRAHALQSDNLALSDTAGWIFFLRKDYSQSLVFLRECVTRAPDNPEFQYHLGMTYYMMGAVEKARAAFETALGSDSQFEGREEAGDRLARLRQIATEGIGSDELEEMVKNHPKDPLLHSRLGKAYQMQNNSGKAREAYEKAVGLNPQLLEALMGLSNLYLGPLENAAEALTYARKARALAPENPEVSILLGRATFRSGDFTSGRILLQPIANLEDADPVLLHELAITSYASGDTAEAEILLERILRDAPGTPAGSDARTFAAMLALTREPPSSGEFRKAIDQALASDPHNFAATLALAAFHEQEGMPEKSTELLEQTLERFPQLIPAQLHLARRYLHDSAGLEKAFKLVSEVHRSRPEDPATTPLLAEIYYKREEFPQAIRLLRQSASKAPLGIMELYYLGMSLIQNREEEAGREALEAALAGQLPEPFSSEARTALAKD